MATEEKEPEKKVTPYDEVLAQLELTEDDIPIWKACWESVESPKFRDLDHTEVFLNAVARLQMRISRLKDVQVDLSKVLAMHLGDLRTCCWTCLHGRNSEKLIMIDQAYLVVPYLDYDCHVGLRLGPPPRVQVCYRCRDSIAKNNAGLYSQYPALRLI